VQFGLVNSVFITQK